MQLSPDASATPLVQPLVSPVSTPGENVYALHLLCTHVILPVGSAPLAASAAHEIVPVCCATGFVLLGAEALAVQLEVPFGDDQNDLPLETYCNGTERASLNVLRFDANAGPEGPSGGESSGGEM